MIVYALLFKVVVEKLYDAGNQTDINFFVVAVEEVILLLKMLFFISNPDTDVAVIQNAADPATVAPTV